MNTNKVRLRRLVIILLILFSISVFTAYAANGKSNKDASLVFIKNASMSTYGTGFAVGVPGEEVDIVVTSYSVVATANGAAPKKAKITINDSEKNMTASVVYHDAGRNLAILKLADKTKSLKPLLLKSDVLQSARIYVRGYDGTGNIMSDFEKFNKTDIIQYTGNISKYDEMDTISVYKYSNEFNRAMVGAPAYSKDGYVVGMCAYSLNSMNTYSQYILSSEELMKCLDKNEIRYMTSDELFYKNIITINGGIGVVVLLAIIIFTVYFMTKKKTLDTRKKYIRCIGGNLTGSVYEFKDKLTIGSDAQKCDIVFSGDEPGISAEHCAVQMLDGDCYLVDRFSKNGTFLENGTKIQSSYPYKIEGGSRFVFYVADSKNRFELIDKKELKK